MSCSGISSYNIINNRNNENRKGMYKKRNCKYILSKFLRMHMSIYITLHIYYLSINKINNNGDNLSFITILCVFQE